MVRSILDDLGEEVTGIVAPVSICMALTVALVRLLNPDGSSGSSAVYIASVYYNESDGDSTGQKLSGAVINALIFVGIISIITFGLVLLFKYRCTKLIYAYMGLSGFSIFFVLTGVILIELLHQAGAHMDWISFGYILFNFAVVGAATLFVFPAPLLMKQSYLIVTGVAVAFVFSWIPEWTTWVLLVAMALYDIVAVLIPGGPLKMLVELAQEREVDIPALVYQARPSKRLMVDEHSASYCRMERDASVDQFGHASNETSGRTQKRPGSSQSSGRVSPRPPCSRTRLISPAVAEKVSSHHVLEVAAAGPSMERISQSHTFTSHDEERVGAGFHLRPEQQREIEMHPSEATVFSLPESIKLGLGDFIFYSVLVGRAAMYDMLTVFACYLAIVAGLGCTLLLLALAHKALPALPVSIALAVMFYFVSRLVLEPVVLPMTLNLVFF